VSVSLESSEVDASGDVSSDAESEGSTLTLGSVLSLGSALTVGAAVVAAGVVAASVGAGVWVALLLGLTHPKRAAATATTSNIKTIFFILLISPFF
jgi:hypothetical protein